MTMDDATQTHTQQRGLLQYVVHVHPSVLRNVSRHNEQHDAIVERRFPNGKSTLCSLRSLATCTRANSIVAPTATQRDSELRSAPYFVRRCVSGALSIYVSGTHLGAACVLHPRDHIKGTRAQHFGTYRYLKTTSDAGDGGGGVEARILRWRTRCETLCVCLRVKCVCVCVVNKQTHRSFSVGKPETTNAVIFLWCPRLATRCGRCVRFCGAQAQQQLQKPLPETRISLGVPFSESFRIEHYGPTKIRTMAHFMYI